VGQLFLREKFNWWGSFLIGTELLKRLLQLF
jgi:hypothetical protein